MGWRALGLALVAPQLAMAVGPFGQGTLDLGLGFQAGKVEQRMVDIGGRTGWTEEYDTQNNYSVGGEAMVPLFEALALTASGSGWTSGAHRNFTVASPTSAAVEALDSWGQTWHLSLETNTGVLSDTPFGPGPDCNPDGTLYWPLLEAGFGGDRADNVVALQTASGGFSNFTYHSSSDVDETSWSSFVLVPVQRHLSLGAGYARQSAWNWVVVQPGLSAILSGSGQWEQRQALARVYFDLGDGAGWPWFPRVGPQGRVRLDLIYHDEYDLTVGRQVYQLYELELRTPINRQLVFRAGAAYAVHTYGPLDGLSYSREDIRDLNSLDFLLGFTYALGRDGFDQGDRP